MKVSKEISNFLEKNIGSIKNIEELTSGGSGRKYYRLHLSEDAFHKTVILVENNDIRENETFVKFSLILSKIGINTPQIFFFKNGKHYLQEDLGDKTLLNEVLLKNKNYKDYYKSVLEALVKFQTQGINRIKKTDFYTHTSLNDVLVYRDLFYFKDYFLDLSNKVKYLESELLKDFQFLVKNISNSKYRYLMYRDLQGRNIMLKEKKVYFIDYQGAMLGPCVYDVISLLWQAKANLSNEFKNEMLAFYYDQLSKVIKDFNVEEINKDFQACLILRLLQVLGAYGKLGLIQKKKHFLESIQYGIDNLKDLLNLKLIEKTPCIKDIIYQLQEKNKSKNE